MSGPGVDVAVNLLWVAPGRVGGSEQYLERQLLGVDDDDVAVSVYCTRSFAAAHPELVDRHRVVVAPGGQAFEYLVRMHLGSPGLRMRYIAPVYQEYFKCHILVFRKV